MATLKPKAILPAEIESFPNIMGGLPCVSGTRIPAETILAQIEAGYSEAQIFADYPSLPLDGIDAVRRWADEARRPIRVS